MKDGFVYFLRCGSLVKIGFSTDPLKRIWALIRSGRSQFTVVPGVDLTDIECLGIIPGTPDLEKAVHGAFEDLVWAGEWFMCDRGRIAALSPEPLRVPLEWNVRTDMDKIGMPWDRLLAKLSVPCVLNAPDQMRPASRGIRVECAGHGHHYVPGVNRKPVVRKTQWTVTYA